MTYEINARPKLISIIDDIPVWTVTFGVILSEIGAFMIWGVGGVFLLTGIAIVAASAAVVLAKRLVRG